LQCPVSHSMTVFPCHCLHHTNNVHVTNWSAIYISPKLWEISRAR
jgi:hypothetical protein